MSRDNSPQRKPTTYLKEIIDAVNNWVLYEEKFDFHPPRPNATLKKHIQAVNALPITRNTKIYCYLFLALHWAEVTEVGVVHMQGATQERVQFETGFAQKILVGWCSFQHGDHPVLKFTLDGYVKSMKAFLRAVEAWRTGEYRWNIWPLE